MNADFILSELSTNQMTLDRPTMRRKAFLNFVTPTNWQVGDTVAMQINRPPYDVRLDNGRFVVELPPEPIHGWEREFYTLYNTRTKDRITVDFDTVKGFEELAAEARKKAAAL